MDSDTRVLTALKLDIFKESVDSLLDICMFELTTTFTMLLRKHFVPNSDDIKWVDYQIDTNTDPNIVTWINMEGVVIDKNNELTQTMMIKVPLLTAISTDEQHIIEFLEAKKKIMMDNEYDMDSEIESDIESEEKRVYH